MANLDLFRAAALGRDDHVDRVARHHLDVDHARGVVLGVDALAGRIGQHRGAQLVVRVHVGAAHAFVDHVFHAHGGVVPAHVHADFRNTVTMPVSWQIGRWPSAHMRELIRICAIASLAAGDSSRS
jgi:hypothetical protein